MAENPILIDEIQYKKNFLLQQTQSLKDGAVVLLKQKLGVSAITFKDIGVNTSSFEYDCKYELKKIVSIYHYLYQKRGRKLWSKHIYTSSTKIVFSSS